MAVEGRAEGAWGNRVFDEGEAASRFLSEDQKARVAATELGNRPVAGTDLPRALRCVKAAKFLCGLSR